MITSLDRATISQLRQALDTHAISAPELTRWYLDRIAAEDGKYNAWITVDEEGAMAAARQAQQDIMQGRGQSLTGIPISLKDNLSTKGLKTTCGSAMLEHYVPVYDAWVVTCLRKQNAVLLGKTNMDPFAMGNTTQTSHFGPVNHPRDPQVVAGGSSGGAAVSVATGMCAAALGSDTGGSIRQPAAFCGVTGLKPTYGAVSRYGLVAFASSLDQIGPLCHDAVDCGILLDAISAFDEGDATMRRRNQPVMKEIPASYADLTVGVLDFTTVKAPKEICAAMERAVTFYRSVGCRVDSVTLTGVEDAVAAYYLLSSAQAASNLSRFDGIRYGKAGEGQTGMQQMRESRTQGLEPEVQRRILLGNHALRAEQQERYYRQACFYVAKLQSELQELQQTYSILLMPTLLMLPPKVGEWEADLPKRYAADVQTVLANLSGLPAISVPAGAGVGLSLMGRPMEEGVIIGAAAALEQGGIAG